MTTALLPAARAAAAIDVSEALIDVFVCADERDWKQLRSRFADHVELDWTSLTGGDPVTLSGEQLTANWRALLGAFDATHHQIGNILIDELHPDEARVRCYGTATHRLAVDGQDGRWVLGGRYQARLVRSDEHGWRVAELTLIVVWGEGNQNLLALAAQAEGVMG
jgi:SnoaL-like domain